MKKVYNGDLILKNIYKKKKRFDMNKMKRKSLNIATLNEMYVLCFVSS